jgi:hypothetical protein
MFLEDVEEGVADLEELLRKVLHGNCFTSLGFRICNSN